MVCNQALPNEVPLGLMFKGMYSFLHLKEKKNIMKITNGDSSYIYYKYHADKHDSKKVYR